MTRAILLAFVLMFSMTSLAESGHFLRKVGGFSVTDLSPDHGRLRVSAAADRNKKLAVTIEWTADQTDAITKPLVGDGWFVFAEDMFRVWVFDGERLSLIRHTPKSVSDESSQEVYRTCPKQVREALPAPIRKTIFHD